MNPQPPAASIDPHDLIPPPGHDRIDPFVQRWVAGTNGNLYVSAINKLERYPIPRWPGPRAPYPDAPMLDIGCGWGRWMVAAAKAGWRPRGVDLKSEAAAAANRVLNAHGYRNGAISAQLTSLPFPDSHFELVFSYSVLQHVSRERARACVGEIQRVLKPGGHCLIELPLYPGFTNWRHGGRDPEDPDSWDVRYYRWDQVQETFRNFSQLRIDTDCILGIGVRFEDIDLLPWKYKPIAVISEAFRLTSIVCRPLTRLSDSIFVLAQKQ